jgi:hypothetical protein
MNFRGFSKKQSWPYQDAIPLFSYRHREKHERPQSGLMRTHPEHKAISLPLDQPVQRVVDVNSVLA